MTTLYVAFKESIPLSFSWSEDSSGSATLIQLIGSPGGQLNNAANQLCWFAVVDPSTVNAAHPDGVPLTGWEHVSLLLDTVNTRAVYPINPTSGPSPLPVGTWTIVGVYDSTNTSNSSIKPYYKKVYGKVVVQRNATGDLG